MSNWEDVNNSMQDKSSMKIDNSLLVLQYRGSEFEMYSGVDRERCFMNKLYRVSPSSRIEISEGINAEIALNHSLIKYQNINNFLPTEFYSSVDNTDYLLCFEQYPVTLKHLVLAGEGLTIDGKIDTTLKMINTFRQIVKIGCHHGNINPYQFMYEEQFQQFKLKSFVPKEIEMRLLGITDNSEWFNCSRAYAAPELLDLYKYNIQDINKEQADIFSLGLCIFELFSNENSFGFNNLSGEAVAGEISKYHFLPAVENLLHTMLSFSPGERGSFEECFQYFKKQIYPN